MLITDKLFYPILRTMSQGLFPCTFSLYLRICPFFSRMSRIRFRSSASNCLVLSPRSESFISLPCRLSTSMISFSRFTESSCPDIAIEVLTAIVEKPNDFQRGFPVFEMDFVIATGVPGECEKSCDPNCLCVESGFTGLSVFFYRFFAQIFEPLESEVSACKVLREGECLLRYSGIGVNCSLS